MWLGNQFGFTFKCKILPSSLDEAMEIYWTLEPNDFPEPQHTKIIWDPWDTKNNRPHVGVGTSPKLKVIYDNPQSKYNDYMPPDNRWFGKKKITVQVGNETIVRSVWLFFYPQAPRFTRQGGKKEEAWFHYYKEGGVVPALANQDFEYDDNLGGGVIAAYKWNILGGRYYVGPETYLALAKKPVFNVNAAVDSYSEENYPKDEQYPIHHIAKYCEHEFWHDVLEGEVRWPFGLGHADRDGDGLSNAREAEIGTKRRVKDTCGISRFNPGDGTDYSSYAGYADQELFCRWKQGLAPKGNVFKDWSIIGAQGPPNRF
jgi:hypothetical protein